MAGMFHPYQPGQAHLFPASPRDWLPDDHLVHFISDVVDQLDLSCVMERYRAGGKGELAYHPRMMLKLLIYAYCVGVFASRKVAAQIHENVAFRFLAAGHFPAHRTICRFRQEHLAAFSGLFVQVVQIAQEAGLVKMGRIAIDGTKMKANANKHKAMTYERMQEEERRLTEEIEALTKAAEDADSLDDKRFGRHFRGDELPDELKRREDRHRQIQEAKARLEKRKAEEARRIDEEKKAKAAKEGREPPTERPNARKYPKGQPKPKDQENFTDPDSRIMKAGSGAFEQAYNAQIAVDEEHQMIIANHVTQCAADNGQLQPMVAAASDNTCMKPTAVLADAGYRSESGLRQLEDQGIEPLISLGREGKQAARPSDDMPATQRMHERLQTDEGRRDYGKRKHIVEPVFGWIRTSLGFRGFSVRGLAKTAGEWSLVCLALNLKRMARCGQMA